MTKESWKSTLGFVLAAIGSAVGLANIWRFPYIMGTYGGGAFLIVYVLFLVLLGYPMISLEVWAGAWTQRGPRGAFETIASNKTWGRVGLATVGTGFIISAFYSMVCGWILYYLVQSLFSLEFYSVDNSFWSHYFQQLLNSPEILLTYHFAILCICALILMKGVKKGLEWASRWMVPLLIVLLSLLAIQGCFLQGGIKGALFVLTPNWQALNAEGVLTALGQAFFTLSLGQGTMITYGSYLQRKSNICRLCFPIVLMDTVISLLSAVAVFSVVFAFGLEPNSGEGLIFMTLPLAFQQMAFGKYLFIAFLLLVLIAAVSSEISALEPSVNYLVQEKKLPRKKASLLTCLGAFILGIPFTLSFSTPFLQTASGENLFSIVSFIVLSFVVPLGALAILHLVFWNKRFTFIYEVLGLDQSSSLPRLKRVLQWYLKFCLFLLAPLLIGLIFLSPLWT